MVTEGKWTVGDGNEDASNPRDKIQARSQDIDIIRAHDLHDNMATMPPKTSQTENAKKHDNKTTKNTPKTNTLDLHPRPH